MSAHDNLSPAQFLPAEAKANDQGFGLLHGTRARLRPGDLITPGRPSLYPAQTADTKSEHVFATTDPLIAHYAARHAADSHMKLDLGMDEEDVAHPRGNYTPASPRIYQVEPTGPMSQDQEGVNAGNEGEEITTFQSKHPLRVVKQMPRKWGQQQTVDEMGEDLPYGHSIKHSGYGGETK
jgi:hypothetical protein